MMKSTITALLAVFLNTVALAQGPAVDPDADYDRLDGRGASGKKVDVIEWEGNLEVHVYPAGSLKGLALKLDKRDKNKTVMVIGYRFENNPNQTQIRRAILGIPLAENFQVFRDPRETDFDKIIISNNGLSSELVTFKLDVAPTQLYPDGHPALKSNDRKVANEKQKGNPTIAQETATPLEEGAIKPFSW